MKIKFKFSRSDIINQLIQKFNYKRYLEIGVRNMNDNFVHIKIPFKESIDPNPVEGQHVTYKMTSDQAFEIIMRQNKIYDIIFIDGLHLVEQVDKDIENSLKVLAPNGTIVLHDCNPPTEKHIVSYEIYLKNRGNWNGTVWQSIVKLRCNRKDLQVQVVDTDWGCGIIRRGKQILYPHRNDKDILEYQYLEKHRTELLNLISVKNFTKIYKINK